MAHLERENISLPKTLIVKQKRSEKWDEEEESSEDEGPKEKYLMTVINKAHPEENGSNLNMF